MIVKEVINDVAKHHSCKSKIESRHRYYFKHREKLLETEKIRNITFTKSITIKRNVICPKCGEQGNLFYILHLNGYKKTLHFCVADGLYIWNKSRNCVVSNDSEMRAIAKEVVTDNLFQYLLYEAIWKLVKWQYATNQEKSIAFVNLSRFGL